MSDPFSDRYWVEEFQVTEADLDRIEQRIRETNEAHDLTALARRVVRGRLRYGPEKSPEVEAALKSDASVRLWDAEEEWEAGDQVIVVARDKRKNQWFRAPYIGEVVRIREGENRVEIRIDAKGKTITYSTKPNPAQGESYERWRRKLRDLITPLRGTRDVERQVDYVLFQHEHASSRLVNALGADKRFVRLEGRWFLRELVVPATIEQLAALAWAMLPLEESKPTADLVSLVHPPLAEGDAGLYGLYLALRDSAVFENADPGQRPRWFLAGPPPGGCTTQHAAYDPESYEVLCVAGEAISVEVGEQLWKAELLRAVVGSS